MTSVGVMASSVVTATCTDVLSEPFDHLAAWTLGAGITVVAGGRTGNGAQITSSSNMRWTIPAVNESDYLTIGFAFKLSSLGATRNLLQLTSDADATVHTTLRVTSTGAVAVLLGGVTGGAIATSAANLVTSTTIFYYVELQIRLDDTAGSIAVRLDGTTVASASNVDTKNVGTKAVFDNIRLLGTAAVTEIYDDLYLSTGAGCAFKGDQTIVNSGPDVLLEPFNNLSAWANNGATIVAGGRTGNGMQTIPVNSARYQVTAAQESATFTVGFAYFVNGTQSGSNIIQFLSDAGGTIHLALAVGTLGNLTVNRGGATQIGSTAPNGTIVTSTWHYVEMQATLHDTVGAFTVRINGTVVASGTNVDTKNAGTKTVFDSIRLGSGSGGAVPWLFDDLYVTIGAGAAFKGSITIP